MIPAARLLLLPIVLVACHAGDPQTPPPPAPPAPATATPASPQLPPQAFAPDEPGAVFVDPDRRRKLESAYPEVDAIVAEAVSRGKLPGAAVGVVIDGELAYAKGFGAADATTRTPIDADTVFGLASVSKPFTALTVLALRDDHLLSLDDPLVRWVPEAAVLVYPARDAPPITIRHLLTHTSGLPGDGTYRQTGPTEQELLASLNGVALERAPGTRFRYSNLGYQLLGVVIARAGHGSFREVVKKRILDPLGMTATGWDAAAVAPGKLATPHLARAGVAKPIAPVAFGARDPSGGMLSSVRDLARFVAFQLAAYPPRNEPERGPVLRSTVREAHLNAVDANGWFPDRDVGLHIDLPVAPKRGEPTIEVMSDKYGFGWGAVQSCELDDLFWHAGGGEAGYGSIVQFVRDRGVGIIALWNVFGGGYVPVSKIMSALARTGGLSKRLIKPDARYDVAMKRFLRVYNQWSEPEYLEMAARTPEDAPAEKEELAGYKALHGTCSGYSPIEAVTPYGFRFAMRCERGALTMLVSLMGDGRIGTFAGTSRDVDAPPRLRAVGERLVGLVAKWDDAWARKHLAKAKPHDDAARELEDLRWSHQACKVTSTMHDWTGWKLLADCERGGPLALLVSVDDKDPEVVTSYAFRSAGDARCPVR